MKVKPCNPQFEPIDITLESEAEYKLLISLIGSTTVDFERELRDKMAIKDNVNNFFFNLYTALFNAHPGKISHPDVLIKIELEAL